MEKIYIIIQIRMINCERCWKEVKNNWGKKKYCTKCSNIVARERQAAYREQQRALHSNIKSDA